MKFGATFERSVALDGLKWFAMACDCLECNGFEFAICTRNVWGGWQLKPVCLGAVQIATKEQLVEQIAGNRKEHLKPDLFSIVVGNPVRLECSKLKMLKS